MFDDKEKNLLEGGHISKKLKKLLMIGSAAIIGFLAWLIVNYGQPQPLNFSAGNQNQSNTSSESYIAKIQSGDKILLFKNYIILDGKHYQIEMQNGQLMVMKNGHWIPLTALSASANGAILSQGGHLYRYVDGKLEALNPGDIIRKDGESFVVGADGKLHPINTKGIIWKNGIPYTVGPDGKLHRVKDGEVVMVNGKAMKWDHGKFVPVGAGVGSSVSGLAPGDIVRKNGQSYMVGPDGKLHPINTKGVIWKNGIPYTVGPDGKLHRVKEGETVMVNGKPMKWDHGKFVPVGAAADGSTSGLIPGDIVRKNGHSYLVGPDGKLHPIQTKGIVWKNGVPYTVGPDGKLHRVKEGEVVMVNGKPMKWDHGKFVPLHPGEVASAHKNGTFGVTMGKDGKPLYYEYKDGKLVPVSKGDLKPGDIVYYNGKAYRVGKDGKLHALKAGDTVWRDGKLYTVSPSGTLRAVKSGEIVSINGKPYIYKDGKLVPMTAQEALEAVKNKSIAWIDGKPYLMDAEGQKFPIKNGQIIFRGGQAYRYINGQFVKLTPEEVKQLEAAKNPKPVAKKAPIERPVVQPKTQQSQNAYGGNSKELEKAITSGFGVAVVHSSVGGGSGPSGSGESGYNSDLTKSQMQTNNLLKAISSKPNAYEEQNMQSSKEAFMNNATTGTLPSNATDIRKLTSPYTIMMGTMLNATLVTGIDSDLPGEIIAQINQNVFDSITGNYLLIPQGTKVIGKYDSSVSYGQNRVLLVWTTLILPDGEQVNLQGQPGVGLNGLAGLTGDVNNHWGSILKNVLMMSVFGGVIQVAAGGASGSSTKGTSATQLVAASLGQQIGQAGLTVIQKSMNIQPTINIKAGDNFKILLTRNFILPSPYRNYNKPAVILQQ
jgi:type IV secretory pathway VirB10-like protein|tara:strand:- start:29633 stop:32272 length:2640 start_codon:yes stop_codon:yes gene_type:complete